MSVASGSCMMGCLTFIVAVIILASVLYGCFF